VQLSSFDDPRAVKAKLEFLVHEAPKGPTRQLENILDHVDRGPYAFDAMGDAVIGPILTAGKAILTWPRKTVGDRESQARIMKKLQWVLGHAKAASAARAATELAQQLAALSSRDVPLLEKLALTTDAFEDADAAIAEIAGLDSSAAMDALRRIRRAPDRYMTHTYVTDNEDVEAGYSPKTVQLERSSKYLGEELGGAARARWAAAALL
jgi:hypothetical protein